MDHPAIDHSGIQIPRIEEGRHHRRGRRLAMRAGNRHVRAQPHQFRKHFCAAHNRQSAQACLVQLWIAWFDRCGNHHDFGII